MWSNDSTYHYGSIMSQRKKAFSYENNVDYLQIMIFAR